METEKNTGNNWRFNRGRRMFLTAVIGCVCCMVWGCRKEKTPEPATSGSPVSADDAATRELRAIGDKVLIAVTARDVDTLLQYDHVPEDEASLKNKSGDLYCYVFDSSCLPNAKSRSVYEIFVTAHQLAVEASVAQVPVKGKRYGLLMFYDKAKISAKELYSQDYLCSETALRETAAWHFVLSDGKWSTSTLFDFKTDRLCNK